MQAQKQPRSLRHENAFPRLRFGEFVFSPHRCFFAETHRMLHVKRWTKSDDNKNAQRGGASAGAHKACHQPRAFVLIKERRKDNNNRRERFRLVCFLMKFSIHNLHQSWASKAEEVKVGSFKLSFCRHFEASSRANLWLPLAKTFVYRWWRKDSFETPPEWRNSNLSKGKTGWQPWARGVFMIHDSWLEMNPIDATLFPVSSPPVWWMLLSNKFLASQFLFVLFTRFWHQQNLNLESRRRWNLRDTKKL